MWDSPLFFPLFLIFLTLVLLIIVLVKLLKQKNVRKLSRPEIIDLIKDINIEELEELPPSDERVKLIESYENKLKDTNSDNIDTKNKHTCEWCGLRFENEIALAKHKPRCQEYIKQGGKEIEEKMLKIAKKTLNQFIKKHKTK